MKNEKSGPKNQKKQGMGKQKGKQPSDPLTSEASTSQSINPTNIKKEQPAPQQTIKKIIKVDLDEAKTLAKLVFKSDPNTQMKDFIRKAAVKTPTIVAKMPKTPADSHPAAVTQDLLDTDDDVADNLGRLFKTVRESK